MNILLDRLPDYVEADGRQYKIRTDFRVWIRFDLLISQGELTPETLLEILKLCYALDRSHSIPQTAEKALNALAGFYAGEKISGGQGGSRAEKQNRIYSFSADADYIYSAFMSQYNIRLNRVKYLHWWEFQALFQGLDESHKLSKIMEYRAVDLGKIKDKEQKRFYQKMKRLYALPDTRSQAQKEADMLAAFSKII